MRTCHWSFLALALLAVLPVGAQLSDVQIVANAYPQELANAPEGTTRFSTFVKGDLNRTGETLLIALYTNGTRAAIDVVNRGGQVLAHPDARSLKGFKGEIEILDLDGDDVPEIIIRLYSSHSTIPDTWIFAWRNHQLTLISPTQRVHMLDITILSQIAAVDLDGTGKMAILAFAGVRRDANNKRVANGDGIVYALVNDRYVATTQTFRFAQSYYRHAGPPSPVVKSFSALPGSGTLRIINGARPGGSTVDSADVTLNGAVIAGPSAFNKKVHVITVPVQLITENTLSVELKSKPGAGLWIVVSANP